MMPEHKPFQLDELHLLAMQVNCIEMGQDWSTLYRQHVARLINEVRRLRAYALCHPMKRGDCPHCVGLGFDHGKRTEDVCPECDGTGKSAEARLMGAVIPDYLASEAQVTLTPGPKQRKYLVRLMPVHSLAWHEYTVCAKDEDEAFSAACRQCPPVQQFGGCWDSEVRELEQGGR